MGARLVEFSTHKKSSHNSAVAASLCWLATFIISYSLKSSAVLGIHGTVVLIRAAYINLFQCYFEFEHSFSHTFTCDSCRHSQPESHNNSSLGLDCLQYAKYLIWGGRWVGSMEVTWWSALHKAFLRGV